LPLLEDLRAGRITIHAVAGNIRLTESPALWAGFILLGEP